MLPLRSHRFCKPTPSLVQGGETYSEGFGITTLIPKNFLHQSFEAEEVAKELTIKADKAKAKAEAEAKDEAKEAEQTAKKSAAAKQADTKQKIKKQAAAAKEVAPASTPVKTSPHPPR